MREKLTAPGASLSFGQRSSPGHQRHLYYRFTGCHKENDVRSVRFQGRLSKIYSHAVAGEVAPRLADLVEAYRGKSPVVRRLESGRRAVDHVCRFHSRFPTALRELHQFLKRRLGKLISFVHLLPFYPTPATTDLPWSISGRSGPIWAIGTTWKFSPMIIGWSMTGSSITFPVPVSTFRDIWPGIPLSRFLHRPASGHEYFECVAHAKPAASA